MRRIASRDGDLYVITGPAFIGGTVQKVGNVLVPTHLYKAVYSPRQKAGAGWFVENRADVDARVMTIAQLEQAIGIDLMPALEESEKRTLLRVPNPRTRKKAPLQNVALGAP